MTAVATHALTASDVVLVVALLAVVFALGFFAVWDIDRIIARQQHETDDFDSEDIAADGIAA